MRALGRMERLRRRLRERLGFKLPLVTLDQVYPQHAIGPFSYGDLHVPPYPGDARFTMGAYCSVASGVTVMLGGEHRPDWTTTYPFNELWPEAKSRTGHPATRGDVVIGSDVWIAREAMILSGVTIGNGAVIGARALVRADVPAYGVVAGNPAKLIKLRFEPDLIARLEAIAWWRWPRERVVRALPFMLDAEVERFVAMVEAGEL